MLSPHAGFKAHPPPLNTQWGALSALLAPHPSWETRLSSSTCRRNMLGTITVLRACVMNSDGSWSIFLNIQLQALGGVRVFKLSSPGFSNDLLLKCSPFFSDPHRLPSLLVNPGTFTGTGQSQRPLREKPCYLPSMHAAPPSLSPNGL